MLHRDIALGLALDPNSLRTYASGVQSFRDFCDAHQLPFVPTPETLSYFVVYMCHHIKPASVSNYLSAICNAFEPSYPDVRANRNSPLVARTLQGCRKQFISPVNRKRPLCDSDIRSLADLYLESGSYDDLLFLAIISTGYHGLCRLGELVWPDSPANRSFSKIIWRHSLVLDCAPGAYSFFLPGHKGNKFAEGNTVVISCFTGALEPLSYMRAYLRLRDTCVDAVVIPALFVRENGDIPTRSWFLGRLSEHFDAGISGHSMRAGGATTLALAGVADSQIQKIGRWSFDAWNIYVRHNPVLLARITLAARAHT